MEEIRDSFVIYSKWDEAIRKAPEDIQLKLYHALMDFAKTGEMPKDLDWQVDMFLTSLEKDMKNNIARYNASIENGKKGGRPPKNEERNNLKENLEKPNKTQSNLDKPSSNLDKPSETQEKPKITQQNLDKPSHNLEKPNDNPYVNDNVNVDLVSYNKTKKNIFSDYARTHACERVPIKTQNERQPFIDFFEDYFKFCFSEELKNSAYEVIDTMLEAFYQSKTEEGLKYSKAKIDDKLFCKYLGNIDCEKFQDIVSQVAFNSEIKNPPSYILGCVIASGKSQAKDIDPEKVYTLISQLGELL